MNQSTREIICTADAKAKKDDFQLWKTSQVRLKPKIECLANKGYQGIKRLHPNSRTPKKKPRGKALSTQDKQQNRELAILRVVGEHLNHRLKIFKLLSERYRNRRHRFSFRFNLIAGLYNYRLVRNINL